MCYNFAERSFLSSFVDSHPRSIFEASDYSWFASLDAPPGPITAQLVAGTEQRFGKRARGNRVEFQGLLIVATCDGTDRVFSRIIFISFLTINCPIISRFHLLFSSLSFFFSRKLLSFSSSHCFAH